MVHPADEGIPEDAAGEDGTWLLGASEAVDEQRQAQVSAALHGQRLDKALVSMAPEFSRSHLQTLIDQGHVSVDGRAVTTASRKVLAGQRIEVVLAPTPESRAFKPESLPLQIVEEDDHVLVVDKAAGMVVHPAAGNWTGTLLNAVLAHNPPSAALPRAGIVHRLDKDTSGLMVVGKTLLAVTALTREIAARQVHREYLAIVHGQVRADMFTIEAPIGRDPQSRIRMAVVAAGKAARTDIRCVARRDGYSALRCTLHTGRTHQIRVHLASVGHPLVADGTYGGKAARGMQRQARHAARLGFLHPASLAPLTFEAEGPADLALAWKALTGASATA
jgi:23S rRNA pseudouridine1911/1915/1917 synthase